ncbi:hypothetical protein C8R46DRAFT_1233203 [Mycena filopes]|nr:hypothetical protein C8R46DRAFT_1233203 [Mycena filopes]
MSQFEHDMPGLEEDSDDMDSDSDGEHHSSSTCIDTGEAPSLNKIDTDGDATQCDHCTKKLGAAGEPGTRVFRCQTCHASVQCETCCSGAHLTQATHILQQWDEPSRQWGEQFGIPEVMSSLPKLCGACDVQLAAANCALPWDTVMCIECGPKLLCTRCFQSEHKMRPLHRIKVWQGGWLQSTLTDQGLEFHLGHGGRRCMWPLDAARLTVIGRNGCHNIVVRYCGCGLFEPGEAGRWQQILAIGWHRAGLISQHICSSFRVLTAEQERQYAP